MPVENERLIVVINPASGSSDGNFKEMIEQALQNEGLTYEIRETSEENGPDEIARQARDEGAKFIVACGGDGTVMGVVNGLGTNHSVTVGIVPGGTANLLGKALGIPSDPAEAVQILASGEDRKIDLGCRGKALFALGLGVGLTERFVSQTSDGEKEKMGKLAYVSELAKDIGSPPISFQISLDDSTAFKVDGVGLIIANAEEFNGVPVSPDAQDDDGLLDVCIITHFGILDAIRMGVRAMMHADPGLLSYQASKVRITTETSLDVQIDGEPVDDGTPVEVYVLPKALTVRVPAKP